MGYMSEQIKTLKVTSKGLTPRLPTFYTQPQNQEERDLAKLPFIRLVSGRRKEAMIPTVLHQLNIFHRGKNRVTGTAPTATQLTSTPPGQLQTEEHRDSNSSYEFSVGSGR